MLLVAGECEPVDLFWDGVDISDITARALVSEQPGISALGWAEVAPPDGGDTPLVICGTLVWYPVGRGERM